MEINSSKFGMASMYFQGVFERPEKSIQTIKVGDSQNFMDTRKLPNSKCHIMIGTDGKKAFLMAGNRYKIQIVA